MVLTISRKQTKLFTRFACKVENQRGIDEFFYVVLSLEEVLMCVLISFVIVRLNIGYLRFFFRFPVTTVSMIIKDLINQ